MYKCMYQFNPMIAKNKWLTYLLINHPYYQGVRSDPWHYMYNNLYTDVSSAIKWQGELSQLFKDGQRTWQGSYSSTNIFKARANTCLNNLEHHLDSLHVRHVSLGTFIVDNDPVLSSEPSKGVQSLVMEAKTRYLLCAVFCAQYSCSKTKTNTI